MAPIPKGGRVAVTGAAGFIGGWVVRRLLDKGYRVRACVRDVNDPARTTFLKEMPGYASGRLTLHAADLDRDGCFDEIFKGCHGVCHVSHVSTYDDLAYVQRVCDHVIGSVNDSGSVSRVVVTSSIAAMLSEVDIQELVRRPVIYEDRYPDEQNPKRTPERGQGYSMGKVIAERAFSDAAQLHGGWDAITVLSGRQRRADPVGAPEGHGAVATHRGEDVAGQVRAERRIPPVDDGRRARRRGLPRGDARQRAGEKRRALHRVVDRCVNVEDICASIDRVLPELRHDTPQVSDVPGSHPGARGGVAPHLGRHASCATTEFVRLRPSRSGRSTRRSATAWSR